LLVLGGAPAAHAATDTTAPTWGAVTVSPASIDTSAGPATVTVTARILDDQSGITSGGSTGGGGGNLTFRASSTTQNLYVSFSAANRISGTAQDGVYESTITVPRYAAGGTWSITGSGLSDGAGNYRYTSTAAESAAAGLTASFSQTGAGDTAAPTVTAITLTPSSIDTSTAARTVTVRVRATDDLSGITSSTGPVPTFGGSIHLNVVGPPGQQSKSVFFSSHHRVSGTATDGLYETTLSMPRYSAAGTWRVSNVSAQDSAGNSKITQGADLTAAGLDVSFTQTGAGDTTAPTLSEITVSPTEINPAVSAQSVTVSARITDDLAGLIDPSSSNGWNGGYASVSFANENSSSFASVNLTAGNRVQGTETDGIYQATMTVPRGATGRFTMTGATVADAVGNLRFPSGAELGSASFRTVDTVSIPSAPTKVTARAGNRSLAVSWTPPDRDGGAALTGYQVTAYYEGVHGMLGCDPFAQGEIPHTSSGPGDCDVTVTAPPFATSADLTGLVNGAPYTVRVTAANSAGYGPESDPSPAVKPFDPASDTSPPEVRSLELSPASVDTSAEATTITLTARIADNLSGFGTGASSGSLTLRSPSGRFQHYASLYDGKRISGSALDGTYRTTVTLPRYAEHGTWTASLYLTDGVGNTTTVSTTALAEAGFSSAVEQTGSPSDTTGPTLAGLTISPATVDTGVEQTITVEAHLTDELSGLSPYGPSLWFRSPSGRQSVYMTLKQQSGTAQDGRWTGTTTLPHYSEAGTWTAMNLHLSRSSPERRRQPQLVTRVWIIVPRWSIDAAKRISVGD
jgi:hypothetical protein